VRKSGVRERYEEEVGERKVGRDLGWGDLGWGERRDTTQIFYSTEQWPTHLICECKLLVFEPFTTCLLHLIQCIRRFVLC
jgi:hypothetical protein